MTYQTQSNAYIAYKLQTALGAQASGAGASILRTAGGQAGRLTKAAVESNEVRRDRMSSRGRHGTQKTTGSYDTELSLGHIDTIMEAIMRGAWGAADLAITAADMTSVTTTANTIVAASGSWIDKGLTVGDVIKATDLADAANNGKNLRIVGLTADTITVAETLVVNSTDDTDFTITRPGKVLINPAAGSLVDRYFTVEEHEIDIDGSELFTNCVWGSMKFSMQPNGLIVASPAWTGTGKFDTKEDAEAPFFTSPTETTGVSLAAIDATVRLSDTDFVDLTSFDNTIDTTPNAPDVVASKFAPDVFTGQMVISMNLTCLRADLAKVADFADETPCELHFTAIDPNSETNGFFSFYVPNFTLGSVDKSALSKQGGPRTQTIAVPTALVGKDERGGAYAPTMIKFQAAA
jgi:hypothetical protein